MHGETRDVPQDPSQRRFPEAVHIGTQSDAAQAVRASTGCAVGHCLCCSVRDSNLQRVAFNTGDESFERRLKRNIDDNDLFSRTARILQNIKSVCVPCEAAVQEGMLTEPIRQQYDVSSLIPEFAECVLDPRGVVTPRNVRDMPIASAVRDPPTVPWTEEASAVGFADLDGLFGDFVVFDDGVSVGDFLDLDVLDDAASEAEEAATITILLCPACHRYLDRHLPNKRPPDVAIANVLWFGYVPAALLAGLPPHAQDLCASAFVFSCIIIYVAIASMGSASRRLVGYTRIFEGPRGGIFRHVARQLQDEEYAFVRHFAASDLTEKEVHQIEQLNLIRVEHLRALHNFLQDSNCLMRRFNVRMPDNAEMDEAIQASVRVVRLNLASDELRPQTSDNPDGVGRTSVYLRGHCTENDALQSWYQPTTNAAAVVYGHGNTFMHVQRAELAPLIFPFIFPSGIGFVNPHRSPRLSLATIADHMIRIGLPTAGVSQAHFVGAVASAITAEEIRRSLFFSLRVRPSDLSSVAHITVQAMQRAVHTMLESGLDIVQLPAHDAPDRGAAQALQCAVKLRKRLPCTREERLSFRRHVEGYLYRFGLPTWFLTLTVNINHSRDLANMVRPPVEMAVTHVSDDGVEHVVDFAHLIPQTTLVELVAADLAGHALHFDQLMQEIIRVVLDGGVLGRVAAYVIFPETQRRGGLHGHALLFIEGVPRNPHEFRASRSANPASFDQRLFSYVNSLVRRELSASAASTNEDLRAPCPGCSAVDTVHPINPPPPRMSARTREEPTVSTCQSCGQKWTCTELLRTLVVDGLRADHYVQEADLSANADALLHSSPLRHASHEELANLVHELLWQEASLFTDEGDGVHKALVDAVLYALQGHSPTHVSSCFKGGKVVCRFRYPHDVVAVDFVDELGRVHFRVSALGAWTNAAPLVFIEILRGNADMTFLCSGHFQGAQVALYVTKYVAKDQNAHAGVASRAIATGFVEFMRRTEQSSTRTNFERARAGVFSLLNSLAATEEIEASLLSLRLLTRHGYYASHRAVTFPGGAFISDFLGEPNAVALRQRYVRSQAEEDDASVSSGDVSDSSSSASKCMLPAEPNANSCSGNQGRERAFYPVSDVTRYQHRPARYELVCPLLYFMFTTTRTTQSPPKNRAEIDIPFAELHTRTLDKHTVVSRVPAGRVGRSGVVLVHSNPFARVMSSSRRLAPLDHSKCCHKLCCAQPARSLWFEIHDSELEESQEGPSTPHWDDIAADLNLGGEATSASELHWEQEGALDEILGKLETPLWEPSSPISEPRVSFDDAEDDEPLHQRAEHDEERASTSSQSDESSVLGDPNAACLYALDEYEAWGLWVLVSCVPHRTFPEIEAHRKCPKETYFDLATRLVVDGTIKVRGYLNNMMHAVLRKDRDKVREMAEREAAARADLDKNPGSAYAGGKRSGPDSPSQESKWQGLDLDVETLLAEATVAAQRKSRKRQMIDDALASSFGPLHRHGVRATEAQSASFPRGVTFARGSGDDENTESSAAAETTATMAARAERLPSIKVAPLDEVLAVTRAVEMSRTVESGPPPTNAPTRDLVQHFGRVNQLNVEQMEAYCLLAVTFLQSLVEKRLVRCELSNTYVGNGEQLRVKLCGPGGTGKSAIICALDQLAAHLGHAERIVFLAANNAQAATLPRGSTVHSFLGRSIDLSTAQNSNMRNALAARLQGVTMIVVEEYGLLTQDLLGALSSDVTEARGVALSASDAAQSVTGGLHLVLLGDHLQLSPNGGASLHHQHPASQYAYLGLAVYESLEHAVYLQRLVRARGQAFVDLLTRARVGAYDDTDAAFLSTRSISPSAVLPANFFESTLVLVGTHAARLAVEDNFFQHVAQYIQWESAMNAPSLAQAEPSQLRALVATAVTERPAEVIPPTFRAFRGMLVQVRNYHAPEQGIVRNSFATITRFVFELGTTFKREQNAWIASQPPSHVVVRPDTPGLSALQPSDLLRDPTPGERLIPLQAQRVRLPRSAGPLYNLLVTYHAFPLRPALACTVDGAQGRTQSRVHLIDSNKVETRWPRKAHYVAFSRVREPGHITTTAGSPSRLTAHNLRANGPEDDDMLEEAQNLEQDARTRSVFKNQHDYWATRADNVQDDLVGTLPSTSARVAACRALVAVILKRLSPEEARQRFAMLTGFLHECGMLQSAVESAEDAKRREGHAEPRERGDPPPNQNGINSSKRKRKGRDVLDPSVEHSKPQLKRRRAVGEFRRRSWMPTPTSTPPPAHAPPPDTSDLLDLSDLPDIPDFPHPSAASNLSDDSSVVELVPVLAQPQMQSAITSVLEVYNNDCINVADLCCLDILDGSDAQLSRIIVDLFSTIVAFNMEPLRFDFFSSLALNGELTADVLGAFGRTTSVYGDDVAPLKRNNAALRFTIVQLFDTHHFAFVLLDHLFKRGYLLDSIPAYTSIWHREHIPALRRRLALWLQYCTRVNSPTQPDSVQCGVYACLAFEAVSDFIQNVQHVANPIDVQALERHINGHMGNMQSENPNVWTNLCGARQHIKQILMTLFVP